MNKSHLVETLCIVGLSAACVWGLTGCTAGNEAGSDTQGEGSVAAVADGVKIYEDDITDYIENFRESYGLSDEESWGSYLAQSNTTPAEIRETVIESFISRELEHAHASDRNVTVDESEIDNYVSQIKSNYDTEDKWQRALEQVGLTEEEYRHEIESQLLRRYLVDSFTVDEALDEADQLRYAQMYADEYDGAKRSSHILFASENEQTAQEVLDKINAGELDFAEAAQEYSQDTGSAVNGGDIGWDKTGRLVDEYQSALDGLEKGQVSELVSSQYGIHIIKCTDIYSAPKVTDQDGKETIKITDLNQIPTDWLDAINQELQSQAQSDAYRQWSEDLYNSADITINDMPEDVSYNIDITKYQTDTGNEQSINVEATSDNTESASPSEQTTADSADSAADMPDAEVH